MRIFYVNSIEFISFETSWLGWEWKSRETIKKKSSSYCIYGMEYAMRVIKYSFYRQRKTIKDDIFVGFVCLQSICIEQSPIGVSLCLRRKIAKCKTRILINSAKIKTAERKKKKKADERVPASHTYRPYNPVQKAYNEMEYWTSNIVINRPKYTNFFFFLNMTKKRWYRNNNSFGGGWSHRRNTSRVVLYIGPQPYACSLPEIRKLLRAFWKNKANRYVQMFFKNIFD